MKIAIFSDCHGSLPKIDPSYKIIMICGDICPTNNHSIDYQNNWIKYVFLDWIEKNEFEKVILVPGNHDYFFDRVDSNVIRELELRINCILKILINEHTYLINEDGKKINIFGTPYCKIFGNWAFMRENETLKQLFDEIPENLDILLCHDAPDINGQGVINEGWSKGVNAGNKVLAEAVLKVKPKRLFHGHIHSALRENEFEGILMNNVSLKDERYQNVFPITYIEV